MWMSMVYCVGALNACQGSYCTEGSPCINTYAKTQAECTKQAVERAKALKAEKPWLNVMWKCADYSDAPVEEDKRK